MQKLLFPHITFLRISMHSIELRSNAKFNSDLFFFPFFVNPPEKFAFISLIIYFITKFITHIPRSHIMTAWLHHELRYDIFLFLLLLLLLVLVLLLF